MFKTFDNFIPELCLDAIKSRLADTHVEVVDHEGNHQDVETISLDALPHHNSLTAHETLPIIRTVKLKPNALSGTLSYEWQNKCVQSRQPTRGLHGDVRGLQLTRDPLATPEVRSAHTTALGLTVLREVRHALDVNPEARDACHQVHAMTHPLIRRVREST